jgi:hypothetical protein
MKLIGAALGAIFAVPMIICLSLGGHLTHWEQITWVSLVLFWTVVAFLHERQIRCLRDDLDARRR